MKLFYMPDACSLAPHIILRELDLPFTLDRVDRTTRKTESGEDYATINPKGYVPALQLDDGEVLTEGPAITQYLSDKYAPGRLAPLTGTVERARVNGYLTFIGTEIHKAFSPLFSAATAPAERANAIEKLNRRFTFIEQVLSDGRAYLTGDDFTLADAYLFVVQRWAGKTDFDLSPYPSLIAFAERVASRPAVVAALEAEK